MAQKDIGNLVINRSPGLAFRIGDDIIVTYLGQDDNNAARFRISAPKTLNISRIKSEQQPILK